MIMKKIFGSTFTPRAGAALVLLLALTAQGQPVGLYLKADAGGNLTMDTDLKEFFGAVTPGSKVKFDPGVRVGLGAGYWLTDWFAVEGELAVMANRISSITEATRLDATFSNVPFLVNARFQIPCHCRITPYIGGGLGVSASVINSEHITLNDITLHGDDATAVFAYQGFAGLRYELNHNMGLSLEYRYFATESPSWRADSTSGTDTDRLKFGGARTHALSVAFDFRF
jgi:opacity protein-like surface antigen